MISDMPAGDYSETQKWNSWYKILSFTRKNRSGKTIKVGNRFLEIYTMTVFILDKHMGLFCAHCESQLHRLSEQANKVPTDFLNHLYQGHPYQLQ